MKSCPQPTPPSRSHRRPDPHAISESDSDAFWRALKEKDAEISRLQSELVRAEAEKQELLAQVTLLQRQLSGETITDWQAAAPFAPTLPGEGAVPAAILAPEPPYSPVGDLAGDATESFDVAAQYDDPATDWRLPEPEDELASALTAEPAPALDAGAGPAPEMVAPAVEPAAAGTEATVAASQATAFAAGAIAPEPPTSAWGEEHAAAAAEPVAAATEATVAASQATAFAAGAIAPEPSTSAPDDEDAATGAEPVAAASEPVAAATEATVAASEATALASGATPEPPTGAWGDEHAVAAAEPVAAAAEPVAAASQATVAASQATAPAFEPLTGAPDDEDATAAMPTPPALQAGGVLGVEDSPSWLFETPPHQTFGDSSTPAQRAPWEDGPSAAPDDNQPTAAPLGGAPVADSDAAFWTPEETAPVVEAAPATEAPFAAEAAPAAEAESSFWSEPQPVPSAVPAAPLFAATGPAAWEFAEPPVADVTDGADVAASAPPEPDIEDYAASTDALTVLQRGADLLNVSSVPRKIAETSESLGVPLVHVSFDGQSMTAVLLWSMAWYEYRVNLATGDVVLADRGYDDRPDLRPNAKARADGTVQVAGTIHRPPAARPTPDGERARGDDAPSRSAAAGNADIISKSLKGQRTDDEPVAWDQMSARDFDWGHYRTTPKRGGRRRRGARPLAFRSACGPSASAPGRQSCRPPDPRSALMRSWNGLALAGASTVTGWSKSASVRSTLRSALCSPCGRGLRVLAQVEGGGQCHLPQVVVVLLVVPVDLQALEGVLDGLRVLPNCAGSGWPRLPPRPPVSEDNDPDAFIRSSTILETLSICATW